MTYLEVIKRINQLHDSGSPWSALCNEFEKLFGDTISPNALRKRCLRIKKHPYCVNPSHEAKKVDVPLSSEKEYEIYEQNKIELHKKVFFDKRLEKTPENILSALGYNPENWILSKWKLSNWDVPCKDKCKDCFSVRAVILPKTENDLGQDDFVSLAKEAFSQKIPLFKKSTVDFHADRSKRIYTEKLIEIPPIELHYGKMAHKISSGSEYNHKIAEAVFFDIFTEICDKQRKENAGTALLVIGSDFFNAESDCATTRGTPQQNDLNFKEMFINGLRMYKEAISLLKSVFPKIDVRFCAGNHARAAEFYLYCALKEYFSSSTDVSFSDEYRDTIAYQWGDCSIFFNHGDVNLKRIIHSMPAEFPSVWGRTKFRELHMGHLHSEFAQEDYGITVRRVGSPCGTDDWSYLERFIGAVKKHQIFVWDTNTGLQSIHYINV